MNLYKAMDQEDSVYQEISLMNKREFDYQQDQMIILFKEISNEWWEREVIKIYDNLVISKRRQAVLERIYALVKVLIILASCFALHCTLT